MGEISFYIQTNGNMAAGTCNKKNSAAYNNTLW